jgi:hypothetical protein
MTYEEEELGFLREGSIHYKYKWEHGGESFIIGGMLEEVSEGLRDKLDWVAIKLRLFLQGLMVDYAREEIK